MRHAFDADHIAVDNTTRKLMADGGRRPLSVGFWFSLGHSTIVFGLAFLLSVGVKALTGQVEDDSSELQSITGIIGASVSGVFLWILGILNLVVLLNIIGVFRRMRTGHYDEAELEDHLNRRGFMNRSSAASPDRSPSRGTSTPSECCSAWGSTRPRGGPALSVAVALIIGTIELIGVLADQARIDSGPLAAIAEIPLDYAGYGIVLLFLVAWLVALEVWRFGGSRTSGPPDLRTGGTASTVGVPTEKCNNGRAGCDRCEAVPEISGLNVSPHPSRRVGPTRRPVGGV